MSAAENQFELAFEVAKSRGRKLKTPKIEVRERSVAERVSGIDQVLSTHDVERITGRHRCTIYRWVVAGTFPEKRAGGGRGWLRSDIERWLDGAPKIREKLRRQSLGICLPVERRLSKWGLFLRRRVLCGHACARTERSRKVPIVTEHFLLENHDASVNKRQESLCLHVLRLRSAQAPIASNGSRIANATNK
jgi:predicted DNA-binding transcriptional regulator AlpA